jgi:hypothetical protein
VIIEYDGTRFQLMNSSGALAITASSINGGQIAGFRNRIINGAMVIDQRNAGASVTPANQQYLVDRWKAIAFQASKFSVQQNAGAVTPPDGFTNYLGATSLSAYTVGSGESFSIVQTVEGFNISDLGWGTANAQTISLSFKVRSSLTGTFGGALWNTDATRSYPFSYTISAANTWETKTITIVGDTSGTWLTTNGAGVNVNFSLGTGSTLSNTAGAWAAGNFNSATGAVSVVGTSGATFYITGVQLEAGSTATPFEQRLIGTELMLCQRYAVVYNSNDSNQSNRIAFGMASNATRAFCMVKHPVTMRAKPSLSSAGVFILSDTANADNVTSSTIQSVTSDVHQTNIEADVASGLTQYRPYFYEFGSAGGTLTLSSEL